MMKKYILIVVLIIGIVSSFLLGFHTRNLLDNSFGDEVENTKSENDTLVGVYETDSWNGKAAVLVLYEDGTSLYPSGGESTWEMKDNAVIITVKGKSYDNGKQALTVYFGNGLTETEMKSIAQQIGGLNNVESTNLLIDEYQQRIYIKLIQDDENDETYNAIKGMIGVDSVEYEYRIVDDFTEHEAKIMENGLVLHGMFFKKVSD